jgi:hypothetical protein
MEESSECRAYTCLRPRSLEQDSLEDFNLVELVTFGFEELPALVNGRFYDRIVVFGEGYVGAI